MNTRKMDRHTSGVGMIPQFTMIAALIATGVLFGTVTSTFSVWQIPSYIGLFMFMHCMASIYYGPSKLLTDGLFKYTRHPMYTGIMLIDTQYWLPNQVSTEPLFYILQFTFVVTLCAAGWFQEKETLARYGVEAEKYYKKTPRIIFLYPLTRLLNNQ